MIGVTVDCRIGNQLFQYAFAYATSKRLETNFFINKVKDPFVLPQYFELNSYNPLANIIKKSYYKFAVHKSITRKIAPISINSFETPSVVFSKLVDNASFIGYFQSEEFFKDYKGELIAREFKIKESFQSAFLQKYSNLLKEKYIIVHVRRTDYLNLGEYWQEKLGDTNLSLPISYYQRCLESIPAIDTYKIVFVSDDLDFVKKTFGYKPNYLFEYNPFIIDFQLIMNADIAIIANSSFAWWASYLNNKPNKIIYAPHYWLGFKIEEEYPKGITSVNWNWVKI